MGMSASILPEFDQEMANTRRTLERIPQERFSWKPHEKSYSFMELANHLARLPGWGAATVRTDSLDLDPESGEFVPPPPEDTLAGVLAAFDEGVADFRAALGAATDEELVRQWSLLHSGETLLTMPRIAVLRGMILNHMVHHRGQLTVYLRLNDLPVPALYGPSADEEGM
jgi:uncharacterized damage-inducible protein DinB